MTLGSKYVAMLHCVRFWLIIGNGTEFCSLRCRLVFHHKFLCLSAFRKWPNIFVSTRIYSNSWSHHKPCDVLCEPSLRVNDTLLGLDNVSIIDFLDSFPVIITSSMIFDIVTIVLFQF